jgi:hypothetical protein
VQRRVAALVPPAAGEQHDAVGLARIRGAFTQKRARLLRLQRREREAALRIVGRDEADGAVAQVADPVEEDDRRDAGRGRPYFLANESLTKVAVKCAFVVIDWSMPSWRRMRAVRS